MVKLHNTKIIRSYLVYCAIAIIGLSFFGCSGCSKSGLRKAIEQKRQKITTETFTDADTTNNIVKMEKQNGVYLIPVEINKVPMQFIFDTGASLISISAKEAANLYKVGKLTADDILGTGNFTYANGAIAEGTIIVLREVKIGTKILNNIEATVVHHLDAPLLIGQSALEKFGKISIDYEKNEILFE